MKWTDERSGSFVSDNHGRDHDMTAELALDAEGHFLALRLTGYGNLGGFLRRCRPLPPTLNAVKNIVSLYRTPLIEVATKCVFTNTTLVSAYRGAGRPEGNYYMERLIDYAAAEPGIDRIELRRAISSSRSEMPFKSAVRHDLRQRRFPGDVQARRSTPPTGRASTQRKRESKKRGKLRGIGVGCYLEVTAPPTKEMGGIRFDADGGVTIVTGTLDYGQGHASPFAQVLSEKLGVPFEKHPLLQGDSDELVAGGGTGGSRSMMLQRHRDRRGLRQGDRAGQADRRACARSLRRRYRIQGRPLRHRRHRPRHRHHGAGREAARRHRSCRTACRSRSTSSTSPRPAPRPYPERLPCRRGRDRSRHRHHSRS